MHVLWFCKNAQKVWKATMVVGLSMNNDSISFKDLLIWVWGCYSWAIWNHKNAILFNKEVKEDSLLIEWVLTSLSDFQKVCFKVTLLEILNCLWKPPYQDSFKINVDGVVSLM